MPIQSGNNNDPKRRIFIALIIVLLFVYAYRKYKNRSKVTDDSEADGNAGSKSKGFLSNIRSSGKKKVSFEDDKKSSSDCDDTPNKNKINSLVQEILLKQIPS